MLKCLGEMSSYIHNSRLVFFFFFFSAHRMFFFRRIVPAFLRALTEHFIRNTCTPTYSCDQPLVWQQYSAYNYANMGRDSGASVNVHIDH